MGEAEPVDEVVLHVSLTAGEPLVGRVEWPATGMSHGFCGWLDFMGAINALRAVASPASFPVSLSDLPSTEGASQP
jgi:hypothetical protein